MTQFEKLTQQLRGELNSKPVILVAIDGIGGSGKSTLSRQIRKSLENVHLVELDAFRTKEVYEVDRERLIRTVLKPLSIGQSALYHEWLWGEEKFSEPIEIKPKGIVVVEGVTALHPELRSFYDLKVWVECDTEVAFARGLSRDRNEYKVDTENEWLNEWIPYEREYVERFKPRECADFVYVVE